MEFLGSLMIVIVSCWSFKAFEFNKLTIGGLGLINGGIIAVILWLGYSISNSHFNPSISLSYLLIKKKNA